MPADSLFIPYGNLDATVESVLSALDRWMERNDGHHTEKRTTQRFPFRGSIVVTARHAATGALVQFEAPTRDISVSGLSFVVSRQIRTESVEGNIVLASAILTPETKIVVTLNRGDHDLILVAEIRRVRKVHDNLYECGVRFVGRDETVPPAAPPPHVFDEVESLAETLPKDDQHACDYPMI